MFNHCPFLLRVSFRALTGAALLSLFPPLAHPQVDTAWVKRYRGSGRYSVIANGKALALDSRSSSLYVAGQTLPDSNSRWNYDITVIKYTIAGETLWVRRYNGPGDSTDWACALCVDSRGDVYITGSSWGLGTWEDYATIKYDSAGNQKWVARYDGPMHLQDFPSAIAVDAMGNVCVTGFCNGGPGTNYEDYATVKYDSLGNQVWARTFNGRGNYSDFGNAICVDNRDNVYVTGASAGPGRVPEMATIKYNGVGDTLWVRRYGGPGSSGGKAIAVDSSGSVFVAGWYGGMSGSDFLTIKYDSLGDTLWVRRYDGPAHRDDIVFDTVLDPSGNVYVTGYSFGIGDSADYCTIKYDRDGNQCWVARYNGPGNNWDVAERIVLDRLGKVYVAGGSWGLTPNGDYCTIKYDSLGSQVWVARYDGPASNYDEIRGLAVDDSGNVYVTGTSDGNVASVMCTIKYRQLTGVEGLTPSGVPLHFELSQNVPNPWVSGTRFSYTLSHEDQVVLGVYNPMGQLVRTLLKGKESAGYKQVAWDGRDDGGRRVPSGVYFYRLQEGGFTDTKKMVLIR